MAKIKRKPQQKTSQRNGFDPSAMADSTSKFKQETTRGAEESAVPELAEPSTATIGNIPIHDCQAGYVTTILNCRLTRRQAAAAKVLWSSLSERGDRFQGGRSSHESGTTVESANDGVRWILDKLADAIEAGGECDMVVDFNLSF